MRATRLLLPTTPLLLALVIAGTVVPAADPPPGHDAVLAPLRPYDGPSIKGVDTSTLTGKVTCGYQGWFTTPDDGAGLGWRHYNRRGLFRPGNANIDLWPDTSELADAEKVATAFRHADGRTAFVFSSHRRPTVLRDFR